MTSTATFSTLLRHPNEVIEQLDSGDVVLTRRDGEPLRLSRDQHATREHAMVQAIAQILAPVVEQSGPEVIERVLTVPFPWVAFLPADTRREFIADFVRTAAAAGSIGNLDRLSIVVAGWRETATAYSLGLDKVELEWLDKPEVVANPNDQ